MTNEYGADPLSPNPVSPPGMSTSKSSKSSSFQSLNSDDGSVMTDTSHFEDIGLDDDSATLKAAPRQGARREVSPHSPGVRNLAAARPGPRPRQSFPNLRSPSYTSNPRSTSLAVLTDARSLAQSRKSSGSRSTTSIPLAQRQRSPSPAQSLHPRDPNVPVKPRRGSWQANRERKSLADLEHECDEDDGDDDIPEGLFLDNVPLSPRPPPERAPSRGPSPSPSRSRSSKGERVRSVGNGTPAIAQAQGSLKSPTWKTDHLPGADKGPVDPVMKARALSWNSAHAVLSAEAKALTEKLEEHADELDHDYNVRTAGSARPNTWNSSSHSADRVYNKKERVKSSTPELPPLRKTNIMIDPLPVSKEKEAVLSRTRPSWLPPKDPAEEKRHLREYQKMMAASQKAENKRESARQTQMAEKENTANDLMHIWERRILPQWDNVIHEKGTRELWWQGIPSRSRGTVWRRAFGNELGLTEASYTAALERAHALEQRLKEDKASPDDTRKAKWFDQIRQDVRTSTWPGLRIFDVHGPLHQSLVDVLRAYAMYRSDIGYTPGCNTIAALLILNLDGPASTFVTLANVLNRPLPLAFLASDTGSQTGVYDLVLRTLAYKSPSLHEHLTKTLADIAPHRYLCSILTSLFTNILAIDEAARLWDVYAFEGDNVLIRAAVACLLNKEMALLGSRTEEEVTGCLIDTKSEGVTKGVASADRENAFMRSVREAGKE